MSAATADDTTFAELVRAHEMLKESTMELTADIAGRKAQIDTLEHLTKLIAVNDEKIAKLQQELAKLQQEIEGLDAENENLRESLAVARGHHVRAGVTQVQQENTDQFYRDEVNRLTSLMPTVKAVRISTPFELEVLENLCRDNGWRGDVHITAAAYDVKDKDAIKENFEELDINPVFDS